MDVPVYVKSRFPDFYKAMFSRQAAKENLSAIFTEYAWDTSWCDPCAADPLSNAELRQLGVFWVGDLGNGSRPGPRFPIPVPGAQGVFMTRLHVRYDAAHFPEDLVFQETADRTNFQGRYVLRHAWTGDSTCDAAVHYRAELTQRHEREAQNVAGLTGWNITDIRRTMNVDAPPAEAAAWWQKIWK